MDSNSSQTPLRCVNNCGFFGYLLLNKFFFFFFQNWILFLKKFRNPLTGNLCSKCWRDKQNKEKENKKDLNNLQEKGF